ncbi:hypothetical protein [Marinifilum fragile]|uniref:hypothetical protein n=1 Tax=Marinifilum fragile TaxID=570161 RepID=UPI002AA91BDB|nr:hypothetical protein [Marinifilum fragile]
MEDFNYTGVGLFVSFKHLDGIEKYKLDESDLMLNGVLIKSTQLKIGAEASLFFKNGLIDYMEIWSFDGEYPEKELDNYKLKQTWQGSAQRTIKHD